MKRGQPDEALSMVKNEYKKYEMSEPETAYNMSMVLVEILICQVFPKTFPFSSSSKNARAPKSDHLEVAWMIMDRIWNCLLKIWEGDDKTSLFWNWIKIMFFCFLIIICLQGKYEEAFQFMSAHDQKISNFDVRPTLYKVGWFIHVHKPNLSWQNFFFLKYMPNS